jgi:putative DNA primase/helicase
MSGQIDFGALRMRRLANRRSIFQELVPGGKFRKLKYVVRNPARDDKNPRSFTINYRTGQWADFAVGDKRARGGDVISWFAYARKLDQSEAARQIVEKLSIPLPGAAS